MKAVVNKSDLLQIWKTIYHQIDYDQFDQIILDLLSATLINAWKWSQKQGFNFEHFCIAIKTKALTNNLYQPSQMHQAIGLAITIEKDYFQTKYLHNAWKARDRLVHHFAKIKRQSQQVLKKHPLSNLASENAYKLFQKWWDQHRQWQIVI